MAAPKRGPSSGPAPPRPPVSFARPCASVLRRSNKKDELYAASIGQVPWLQLTLQKTECPTQADINGFSALHTAALFGRLDCLKMLVEKYKVNVDSASLRGWRPVHLVMNKESGNRAVECLQYLISRQADVNVQNQNGVSPLHKAASEGRTSCAKLLVDAGADVHAKDKEGQEPIDLCRMWGHRDCFRYLSSITWKIDKQNLALKMSRLNEIKKECQEKKKETLTKRQIEQSHFNNLVFSKWLAKKHLPPPSGRTLTFLEKGAEPVTFHQHCGRQGSQGFPTTRLKEKRWPRDEQPPWNRSSNPASVPETCIFRPNTVRLGVSPEPPADQDFGSFLFFARNEHREPEIQISKLGVAFPVPALPSETIQRTLFPRTWPSRLRVPQGLRPRHIWDVPRKRPPSPEHRWTDQMAVSLRQTLDPAFVATLKAHLATYSNTEVLFAELDSDRRGSKEPSSPSLSSSSSSSSHQRP